MRGGCDIYGQTMEEDSNAYLALSRKKWLENAPMCVTLCAPVRLCLCPRYVFFGMCFGRLNYQKKFVLIAVNETQNLRLHPPSHAPLKDCK